jgi:lantibiotic modifying enzyme
LVAARPEQDRFGRQVVVQGALGVDLYSGTSGIGLLLAELHAATGEASLGVAARGALRHALSRCGSFTPGGSGATPRPGLYSGTLGVALAAARAGAVLGDPGLVEQAAQLATLAGGAASDEPDFDVISGRAGSILALLALAELPSEPGLVDRASLLGEQLVATAVLSGDRWSWRAVALPRGPRLTGLSHGTSGVALALFELHARTGAPKQRRAAEGALAYERHVFDARAENWPDLRNSSLGAPVFAAMWCHGAPGIALARLRAHQLTGAGVAHDEAIVALRATRRAVASALDSGDAPFCLCHGLAGNAEILALAGELLGEEAFDDAALALRVAEVGLDRYGRDERPWPCGLGRWETPDLFVGLAGIGRFYLRLHDPALPPRCWCQAPLPWHAFLASDATSGSSSLSSPWGNRPTRRGAPPLRRRGRRRRDPSPRRSSPARAAPPSRPSHPHHLERRRQRQRVPRQDAPREHSQLGAR